MIYDTIPIQKDIYDRAIENRGYVAKEDYPKLFSVSMMYGYGIYSACAFEKDGNYYCTYARGESCD